MDSYSAHGNYQSIPILAHIEIYFLSSTNASKLQPLNTRIIASVRANYRPRHLERVVDLSELSVNDIYKVEILTAIGQLKDVSNNVTEESIFDCWRSTGIMARVHRLSLQFHQWKRIRTAVIKKKLVILFWRLSRRLVRFFYFRPF